MGCRLPLETAGTVGLERGGIGQIHDHPQSILCTVFALPVINVLKKDESISDKFRVFLMAALRRYDVS